MTFEEDLRARVIAAPLAAQLAHWEGAPTVHWDDRPEGAGLPAIIFTVIDDAPDYDHDGRDNLIITQVQADTLAPHPALARSISDALGQLLEGAAEVNGRRFVQGLIELARTIPVVGVAGARSVYGRTLRLSIYHKE
ncbi:hypothetical protein SAMN05518849_101544 [Sphingobium sp. AP50]|uniref:hypothetical protein n=1 Tax=Sphingobium sp. AP50 TaxID=1884369 RepID=UPI0008C2D2EE|nr:hypothetical protein [Sphingobium sp. AP50]SEI68270.1 hypothetical protein SAMN05518849_101544 [Sphingobium sp. AP50]